jgi:uncharacterized protein (DUF302 family)
MNISPSDAKHSAGVLRFKSPYTFDDTVRRLLAVLKDHGIKVFATIDQRAEAQAVDLTMPSTVLILFGNPKGGTPLMLANPESGIDLPLKILMSESETRGRIHQQRRIHHSASRIAARIVGEHCACRASDRGRIERVACPAILHAWGSPGTLIAEYERSRMCCLGNISRQLRVHRITLLRRNIRSAQECRHDHGVSIRPDHNADIVVRRTQTIDLTGGPGLIGKLYARRQAAS